MEALLHEIALSRAAIRRSRLAHRLAPSADRDFAVGLRSQSDDRRASD